MYIAAINGSPIKDLELIYHLYPSYLEVCTDHVCIVISLGLLRQENSLSRGSFLSSTYLHYPVIIRALTALCKQTDVQRRCYSYHVRVGLMMLSVLQPVVIKMERGERAKIH